MINPKKVRGPRRRAQMEVTAAIARRILDGEFLPGTILPTEAQLCEQHGVSRTVIRESTKILYSKGLLRSRPRVGTVVRERNDWNLLDQDVLNWSETYIQDQQFLNSVIETLRSVSPEAAGYAAERSTPDHLVNFVRTYQDISRFHNKDPEKCVMAVSMFHRNVYEATRNDVIIRLGPVVGKLFATLLQKSEVRVEWIELSLNAHGRLYEAIQSGSAEPARNSMRTIVEHTEKVASRLYSA